MSCAQPVYRRERRFNPLQVPRRLEAALPYASKHKIVGKKDAKRKKDKKRRAAKCVVPQWAGSRAAAAHARGARVDRAGLAVVRTSEERRAARLVQQLGTIGREREAKRKVEKKRKRAEFEAKLAKQAALFAPKARELKKRRMAKKGAEDKRRMRAAAALGVASSS